MRVVLVEDDPKLAFAVRTLLELAGGASVVETVGTATSAIEVVLTLRPDVVLLDVRLASGDGLEAATEIRKAWPEANIVVYSGEEQELERARSAGFSRTILKGAIADELVALIVA